MPVKAAGAEISADPLPWLEDLVRARRPVRLPVVLTADEVAAVLERLAGQSRTLRIKDLDFGRKQILIRDRKGGAIASRCFRVW